MPGNASKMLCWQTQRKREETDKYTDTQSLVVSFNPHSDAADTSLPGSLPKALCFSFKIQICSLLAFFSDVLSVAILSLGLSLNSFGVFLLL